jgi:hypothetical protein
MDLPTKANESFWQTNRTRTTSVPWYKDGLTEIPPQAREISEKHSNTPSNENLPHILRIMNVLTVSLSPCEVGLFGFHYQTEGTP